MKLKGPIAMARNMRKRAARSQVNLSSEEGEEQVVRTKEYDLKDVEDAEEIEQELEDRYWLSAFERRLRDS